MKNVNVLLAVVLCAGLCVLLGLFNRSADDSLGWNPDEMYMQSISSGEGSSFTSANLSSGNMSNDGIAVSMRNGSFSLRARSSRASMPVATPQASSPSLSGSTSTSSSGSLIGHMTSSAEYHSFGGGHSGNMGSSMTGMTNSGNVAASFAYSSPSYGVASSGLSSYSPITLSSGTDGTQVMSAEQALISTSTSASGLFGSAMQNAYGTASYGDVYGSSANRVNNRFNAPPGTGGSDEGGEEGLGESWLYWLDYYYANTLRWWSNDENGNAVTLDWQAAYRAWEAIVSSWNEGLGPAPTWEQFEKWLWSKGGAHSTNDRTYTYVPVGGILPLLLMALIYMLTLLVKRNKTAQL